MHIESDRIQVHKIHVPVIQVQKFSLTDGTLFLDLYTVEGTAVV